MHGSQSGGEDWPNDDEDVDMLVGTQASVAERQFHREEAMNKAEKAVKKRDVRDGNDGKNEGRGRSRDAVKQ
jgi:hypothetical protein